MIKTSWVLFLLVLGAARAEAQTSSLSEAGENWDRWVSDHSEQNAGPVVQNRQVSKSGRFQAMGPMLGLSDRKDFYTTYVLSFAGRYHFNEQSAWEFLHLDLSASQQSEVASEIRNQTSFQPDVQLSRFQIGTSYVHTPIYGKYAWGSEKLVYFDIFGTAGAGLRFADDLQPFGEVSVGMNHYIWGGKFAVVPAVRWRFYSEQRTSSTFVSEGMLQMGTSWLF